MMQRSLLSILRTSHCLGCQRLLKTLHVKNHQIPLSHSFKSSSSVLGIISKFKEIRKSINKEIEDFERESSPSFVPDGKSLLDRFVFVKTLENFYNDWEKGLMMDVHYVDNLPATKPDARTPVVVALHDTPGYHKSLVPMLTTLAKLGCRTIAPSFPGHGHTQGLLGTYDDVFAQSTAERALFVKDFLDSIGIEKVDLLVGVGASSYTAMHLMTGESANMFKSMALISPWPIDRPRYEGYSKVSYFLQSIYDRPPIRTPLMMALSTVRIAPYKSAKDKMMASFMMNNLNLGEASMAAQMICSLNMPRMVIYPGQDSEVERSSYTQLIKELDIPEKDVIEFQGKMNTSLLPGGVMFPEDGYDITKTRAQVISLYLSQLVRVFHPHIKI